jgi:hypothetical protein
METDCRYKLSYSAFAVLLGITMLLTSCFKEDDPVVLPPPGDAEIFQVSQGENYHRQQYFDLGTTDTLGSEHSAWDLCFEAGSEGWHIWLNGSNLALIANTDTQNFDAVKDTVAASWKWDEASWNVDSTAVGDWRPDRMVYILDRGPDKSSGDRFRKIIFQSVDEATYELQYAELDGSNERTFTIPKNDAYSFVYFTFDNSGLILDIEPDKQRWDLLFTRYRYIFYDQNPPLPYLVTGILINPEIGVAIDSISGFAEINYEKALTYSYSSKRDVIGFDWKYFDFDNQAYVVKHQINYIIRDMEGVYWKLHFIDFYNQQGEKGYPQFEFQRL